MITSNIDKSDIYRQESDNADTTKTSLCELIRCCVHSESTLIE